MVSEFWIALLLADTTEVPVGIVAVKGDSSIITMMEEKFGTAPSATLSLSLFLSLSLSFQTKPPFYFYFFFLFGVLDFECVYFYFTEELITQVVLI